MTIIQIGTLGPTSPVQTFAAGAATPLATQISSSQMALVSSMITQAVASEVNARNTAITAAIAAENTSVQSQIAAAIASISSTGQLRSFLGGYGSAWVSSTSFSVAPGMGVSDDQATMMSSTSSITKTTAAWAVGSGNGGLDSGSIAPNNWYHVFVIERTDTGVVDVLYSGSATAPTLPTSYTKKRRIFSVKTNASSQFIKWFQYATRFMWDVPVNDLANGANPLSGGSTYSLTVPTLAAGVRAIIDVEAVIGSGTGITIIGTNQTNNPCTSSNWTMWWDGSGPGTGTGRLEIATTTAQVLIRPSGTPQIGIMTAGWVDDQGRFA